MVKIFKGILPLSINNRLTFKIFIQNLNFQYGKLELEMLQGMFLASSKIKSSGLRW